LLTSDEIQQIYYAARQYVRLKSQYLNPQRSVALQYEHDRRVAAGI